MHTWRHSFNRGRSYRSLLSPAGLVSLAVLTATILGSTAVSAQTTEVTTNGTLSSGHSPTGVNGGTVSAGSRVDIPILSSSAVATYNRFDSLPNAFSFYTLGISPYVYDPASGILAIIKRGSAVGNQSGNDVYIRTSTNLGITWGAPIGPLHDVSTQGPGRYPSMQILHTPGSSDPKDVLFFYTFPTTLGGDFGNFVSGVVGPDGTNLVPATIDPGTGTETWVTNANIIVSKNNDALAVIGTLSNNNLGVHFYDISTATFAPTFIPPAWAAGKFVPAGTPTSRTSTIAGGGRDNNNVFYAGIYARYPSAETGTTRRVQPYPGVSKSTDNGANWTEIEILPKATISAYLEQEMASANPDSTLFSYSAEDFLVEGSGTAHFLVNFFESDTTKQETAAHLVEITYGQNGWRMRKVSDISGRNFLFITATDTSNQVDNEVMVAKTADESKLLAKWVDLVSYVFSDDIDGNGTSPDTLVTSDVFVSVRSLGSGGSWSAAANVSETEWLDKVTWITKVIPNDLVNIPMIEIHTIPPSEPANLRDSLFEQQRVVDMASYVALFSVDAAAGSGVDSRTVASSGLRLNGPSPNPVSDRALVTFVLPTAGNVRVDLFDVNGQKIQTVFEGSLEAGNRGVVIPTADLAAGSYFYTLTQKGETLSRSMIVVH